MFAQAIDLRDVSCRLCRGRSGAVVGKHILYYAVWFLDARVEQPALAARLHRARLLGDSVAGIEKEKLHRAQVSSVEEKFRSQ